MLIPDPRRTPLPNLISHNGIILYQWEFLRARLDEGEGLPWIAMELVDSRSRCISQCILERERESIKLPIHILTLSLSHRSHLTLIY